MNYHIHFTYKGDYGRSESYAYAKTKEDADQIIEKHLLDKSKPKLVKWRLYKLVSEGDANEG